MSDVKMTVETALAFFDVGKDATEEDLRSKYIQVARENHPDHNPENEIALEKFHLAQKTYEFLKVALFGGEQQRKKHNIYYLELSLADFMSGRVFEEFNGICGQCDGHGILEKRVCSECNGKGGKPCVVGMLETFDICSRCHGTGEETIPCGVCNHGTRYFNQQLDIPPRTRPGTVIALGDSLIELILKQEPNRFALYGDDLVTRVLVPYSMMVFGGKKKLKLPNGQKVMITVPETCPSGKEIRIRNLGVGGPHMYGDLIVSIHPVTAAIKKMSGLNAWCMKRLQKAGI